jgi:hypothetical protein
MTSILAEELRQMIDRVSPHMSEEDVLPIINCVRIEHSDGFLFAVATDRYTIGVARSAVVNTGETWQFSIPAAQLKSVTSWLKCTSGNVDLTTRRDGDQMKTRLHSAGSFLEFSSRAEYAGTYPRWRGILRTALTDEPKAISVATCDARFLARWKHGATLLHTWQAGPHAPIVFMSDDPGFIGAQMPVRPEDNSRDKLVDRWLGALIPTAEVNGITYRLDRQWSDKDGDVWEYTGHERRAEPLMRVVGIEDDDHTLTDLIALYGPIEPVIGER